MATPVQLYLPKQDNCFDYPDNFNSTTTPAGLTFAFAKMSLNDQSTNKSLNSVKSSQTITKDDNEPNDANAQFSLGGLYYNGDGVEQNYVKAREWYEKAAAQGHIEAKSCLGVLYYYGYGVTKDYDKARQYREIAATYNDSSAQNSLGVLYYYGHGVTQNYVKAREWFEKAAIQNYKNAQYVLGIIYHNGYGVEKNYTKAREWYEKAAAQDHADAKQQLQKLSTQPILRP